MAGTNLLRLAAPAALAITAAPAEARPRPLPERAATWREAITPADHRRLARLREAWSAATRRIPAATLAERAELFDRDRALPGAVPPPGVYRCRVFKLGARTPGLLDYVAYPRFACRLARDGARMRFAKLTGSQRPIGTIHADAPRRAVFLGTLVLGDEGGALGYGRDRMRDLVGAVERVGEQRWRIAFPYPAFESLLDVMELEPADAQGAGARPARAPGVVTGTATGAAPSSGGRLAR